MVKDRGETKFYSKLQPLFSSGCDLPQSLHEQVALSLLSEAAQELLARQLLAVHCELRQYGGNKEALN